MITLLAVLAIQASGTAQDVSPSVLVGRMLSYYNDAASMTGKITMTQAAGGASGSIETVLQFSKPSKVYIRQQKSTGDQRVWLVVSDGKKFAYNSPGLTWEDPGKRLVELVTPVDGFSLTIREIYAASSAGLGDRSAPLDIAIGRKEDLGFLKNQWLSVEYRGKTKYGDEDVHVVLGEWRPFGEAKVAGQFRMYITDIGELRQYARSEKVKPSETSQTIDVLTTWDVKLTKNAKPDPALFAAVR